MLDDDDRRHELERLVRMGRERMGPLSPRQALVARTMDPVAWGAEAEEQISYCSRHGLLGSPTHFGAQFVVMRRLALIKAAEVLRAIDRQVAGLPDLHAFDGRATSKRLAKQAFEMHCAALPRGLHTKAAGAIFILYRCDGLPAPDEVMHADGAVTLTWSERGRTARLDVDVDGVMTMTLDPPVAERVAMAFTTWNGNEDDRVLAAVTDWVHHDGPVPYVATKGKGRLVSPLPVARVDRKNCRSAA